MNQLSSYRATCNTVSDSKPSSASSVALPSNLKRSIRHWAAVLALLSGAFLNSAFGAGAWTPITDGLLEQVTKDGAEPAWPGGCSGVVVHRITGEVTVKVVGLGLYTSGDQGASWKRIDAKTISGRDETGWATAVDQNSPGRMASFSLDGTAGWTIDTQTWSRFTSLGRNWDYGSVDWSAPNPKTIIAAKHETDPPGEVYLTVDGGVTWKQLAIHLAKDRGSVSMVGALDENTLIYSIGGGIQRSTDLGATWTQVSTVTPQTRIPVLFSGVHYLGGPGGLIVSRDRGASWQVQGAPVDIWQGPFFGADARRIVVVGKQGVFHSADAGASWTRVADLKDREGGFLFTPNWFGCYAWDPVNQFLYASSMGNPVYRLSLKPTAIQP